MLSLRREVFGLVFVKHVQKLMVICQDSLFPLFLRCFFVSCFVDLIQGQGVDFCIYPADEFCKCGGPDQVDFRFVRYNYVDYCRDEGGSTLMDACRRVKFNGIGGKVYASVIVLESGDP